MLKVFTVKSEQNCILNLIFNKYENLTSKISLPVFYYFFQYPPVFSSNAHSTRSCGFLSMN